MFAGEQVFSVFGGLNSMPDAVKDVHEYLSNNKMQATMMLFFVGSIIQASLMQSGAFEIYFDGKLEFSKLQTKQMPTFEIL